MTFPKEVRMAEVIEVIHVTHLRGGGAQYSVVRKVEQYWSKDGRLLAERDPMPDLAPSTPPDS